MTRETAPDQWSNASLPEAWAGELRVNVVRLLAIVIFYGRHLIEWMLADKSAPIRGRYHLAVTVAVVAWSVEAIMLHGWLLRRRYDGWIKYAMVLSDGMMITLLCVIAGGPRTPLTLLYFGLIASAPLRLSLRLVYFSTAAAMLGYLFLLGYYVWHAIGFHRYYASPELRIPRSEQVITLLAMFVCGLFAGQVVRQIRRLTGGGIVAAAVQEAS